MPLSAGDKLGPYEILARVGKGGMGEVYRAHDSRLNRDVAIKVSNSHFTERFTREARAIAALNHTNICHLYDVGPDYLVMEYVEGQDLRGPLDFEDALPIIQQLIDGIEAAHEKNIIHRDLKPANIKITPEGVVKILDFGLAKAMEPPPSNDGNPENSPTLTIGATQAGTILGTAAYMAPEQAKGKQADKRSDIWSFGVILYEVLTGKKLFVGETVVEILGGVLNKDPDISAAPLRVHRLLRWCLEKDRKKRLASISDARRVLGEQPTDRIETVQPTRRPVLWMALAGLFGLAVAGLAFVHFRETTPEQQGVIFQIAPPPNTHFAAFQLSPDGRHLAFAAASEVGSPGGVGGEGQLWIRDVGALGTHPIAGTEGARYPFWSADSRFVGFFHQSKLKKISIAGGPIEVVCDVAEARGGSWNADGTILFAAGATGPIFRVSAVGGKPVPVTHVENDPTAGHRFPQFLPDGQHFLYTVTSSTPERTGIFVGSLAAGEPVRILSDLSSAVYVPVEQANVGHILFRRNGTLMALSFDTKKLQASGEPKPVADNVGSAANNAFGAFSASLSGTLAFWSGDQVKIRQLIWVDRSGHRLATLGKPNEYTPDSSISLSPDEKTVAVAIGPSTNASLWLIKTPDGTLTRFTFDKSMRDPIWSISGRELIYSRNKGPARDLVMRPVAGGPEQTLVSNVVNAYPNSVSPDGKFLSYMLSTDGYAIDLGLLSLGDHKSSVYLRTPAVEVNGMFSPDGRWMAYMSDEAGAYQVYVQSVPRNGSKFQVSTSAGAEPRWRADGKELYYLSGDDSMMMVPVRSNGAGFEAGTPVPLFKASGAIHYAVTRDGQRFLLLVPAGGEAPITPPLLTVVTHWKPELKE